MLDWPLVVLVGYHRFAVRFGLPFGALPLSELCALASPAGMVLSEDVLRLARVHRHAEFVYAERSARWRVWADALPEVPVRLPLSARCGYLDVCVEGALSYVGRFDLRRAVVTVEDRGQATHSFAL